MNALERKKLLEELIIKANKNKKWIMIEEEGDRWCEYKKNHYILRKWLQVENCLEFKGYIFVLSEIIDNETEDENFLVSKIIGKDHSFRYYYKEETFIDNIN